MAKVVSQKSKEQPKARCRDCWHSYDYHEINYKGELFMCRCKHHKGGEFTKFLSDPACEHFESK